MTDSNLYAVYLLPQYQNRAGDRAEARDRDKSPKDLYLTVPTAEVILNYRGNSLRQKIAFKSLKTFLGKALIPGKFNGTIVNYRVDSVRKKIASKSLKAFLGAGRTVGKFTGTIVIKQLMGATAKVALISLEDFLAIATWESSVILNYRVDSVREKIASKSLKAFLGAGRTVGKFTGNIVIKPELVSAWWTI